MSRSLSLLALFALITAVGCGGRANVRLAKSTTDDGRRSEIDHDDDGHIVEINSFDDDDFLQRIDLTWDGDKLTAFEITNDGSPSYETTVTYDDSNRVSRMSGSTDDFSVVTDVTWNDDGQLGRVERTVETGSFTQDFDFRFDYDDDGRTANVTTTSQFTVEVFGVSNTTTTVQDDDVEYDDKGRVSRVTETVGGDGDDDVTVSDFRYDDDNGGRLDEAKQDGADYELDYDEDGRVIEVLTKSGDNVDITDYEYEEGSLSGFSWTPAIPQSAYFDMEGSSFGELDVMTPVFFFLQ